MNSIYRRVAFILPRASPKPVGALKIIYGLADQLAERGHTIVLAHDAQAMPSGDPHPWHRCHPAVQSTLLPDLRTRWSGPPVDVIVATSWQVVPWLDAYPKSAGCKFHFLQDYETFRLGNDRERTAMRDTFSVGWPVIATSPPIRRIVEPHVRGPLVEIPCAIDTELFAVMTPINSPQRTLVGFAARHERAKRLHDAVRALTQLRAKMPERPDVWCFGDTRLPGIPPWVVRHAQPNDWELRDLYNMTKVFVVSSEYEGFGLPGLEAMACGATLVSTRSGGVDAYADENCAVLCPVRQPEALASAISELLGNETARQRLAAAGAARAACFTWSAAANAFETFLAQHTVRAA